MRFGGRFSAWFKAHFYVHEFNVMFMLARTLSWSWFWVSLHLPLIQIASVMCITWGRLPLPSVCTSVVNYVCCILTVNVGNYTTFQLVSWAAGLPSAPRVSSPDRPSTLKASLGRGVMYRLPCLGFQTNRRQYRFILLNAVYASRVCQ